MAARFTDVVVLPTPPFPFAIARIFTSRVLLVCKFGYSEVLDSVSYRVRAYHNLYRYAFTALKPYQTSIMHLLH